MASPAQTHTAQAIALQTLTSPSNAQNTTDTIEERLSHQPNPGATHQGPHNVHNQAAVQHGATTTPQHSPISQAAPPSPSAPVPRTDDSGTGPVCRWFRDTPTGNAIGLIGLALTLGLGLFSGIASYRDMKWSEHANAVQTCASLYVCNLSPLDVLW